MHTILITGGAGFIGSNLAEKLLDLGYKVIVVDNFDEYYDPAIKHNNIANALKHSNYTFIESDITDASSLKKHLPSQVETIIHLAAKAGVRNSIVNPIGYEEENVRGISKVLELSVELNTTQFIFSSSSSIYGNSSIVPFSEDITDLNPINPYAKSKLLSEQIGKNFSDQYGINFLSLRFFSVYGPRLRPDLVMNQIAKSLFFGETLKIFGDGRASRDFTYVDDIISGIIKAINYNGNKFNIFNLGNGNPISLLEIINIFEKITGHSIKLEFSGVIKGESQTTWADNSKAKSILDFQPVTDIETGIKKYLDWFCSNKN